MSKWNPKQRERVKAKTHGRCGYCGIQLGDKFHVDHMVSKHNHRYFGLTHPDKESNLMAACASCNVLKGSHTVDQFRDLLEGFHDTLLRDARYSCLLRYGRIEEIRGHLSFYHEQLKAND